MIFNDNKKPIIPKGYDWKVEKHEKHGKIDLSKLELHLEPEQKKGYIKGEVLAERMKGKGLNANVLDFLLENLELIPESWKGKYVYFWGTIYRDPDGDLCVRCLDWRGGGWYWGSDWLVGDWDSRGPAAVLASTLPSETSSSSDTLNLESRIVDLENEMDSLKTKLANIFEYSVDEISNK